MPDLKFLNRSAVWNAILTAAITAGWTAAETFLAQSPWKAVLEVGLTSFATALGLAINTRKGI